MSRRFQHMVFADREILAKRRNTNSRTRRFEVGETALKESSVRQHRKCGSASGFILESCLHRSKIRAK